MIFSVLRFLFLSIFILSTAFLPQQSHAIQTIRDAETEQILRELADPIFKAADIEPKSVHLYIVQSDVLNAFVAGGMNIFIHTSLLQYSDSPETLIGVLAHETGHITGGHLLRTKDEIGVFSTTTALGYILGAATAVAGAPEVGTAIAAGTQHTAQRMFLKHSRTQEQAADHAALNFLDKLGYSPQGLLDLLNTLGVRAKEKFGDIDPYAITHPLSHERIRNIQHFMQENPAPRQVPEELRYRYRQVVAKVSAFLEPPAKTLREFPESDTSDIAHYARSIAYYRKPNLTKALAEIDTLILKHPTNAYYHEMRGQMLFENGRITEAIASYQEAESLLDHNALLKTQLAAAMIATEKEQLLDKAITHLRQAIHLERTNGASWHQLAIAYGRQGKLGLSYLALTEKSMLSNNISDAKQYAAYAKQHLSKESTAYQRLLDLERAIEKKK